VHPRPFPSSSLFVLCALDGWFSSWSSALFVSFVFNVVVNSVSSVPSVVCRIFVALIPFRVFCFRCLCGPPCPLWFCRKKFAIPPNLLLEVRKKFGIIRSSNSSQGGHARALPIFTNPCPSAPSMDYSPARPCGGEPDNLRRKPSKTYLLPTRT
jgi:hypothetical protein